MYSVGLAYLFWFVSGFGALGLHRFYLGKIPSGILWMCTGGLGMIGAIYDFFTLPKQVEEANIRKAITDQINQQHMHVHHHNGDWRYVHDGNAKIVKDKEPTERIILRLAKENKGILTPSELALSANLSIDESKKALDALVSKGFAEIRVRKSGTLVYTIPEMMDSDSPLEDF
jgi:TM2 domain-containing membrane protein YozV/predicted transcriptional regulator